MNSWDVCESGRQKAWSRRVVVANVGITRVRCHELGHQELVLTKSGQLEDGPHRSSWTSVGLDDKEVEVSEETSVGPT